MSEREQFCGLCARTYCGSGRLNAAEIGPIFVCNECGERLNKVSKDAADAAARNIQAEAKERTKREQEWKIGYKWVRPTSNPDVKMSGMFQHGGDWKWGQARRPVEYPVLGEARPQQGCGPLTVMETVANARYWRYLFPKDAELWRVRYVPSGAGEIWDDRRRAPLERCCSGTALADCVVLLERVDGEGEQKKDWTQYVDAAIVACGKEPALEERVARLEKLVEEKR